MSEELQPQFTDQTTLSRAYSGEKEGGFEAAWRKSMELRLRNANLWLDLEEKLSEKLSSLDQIQTNKDRSMLRDQVVEEAKTLVTKEFKETMGSAQTRKILIALEHAIENRADEEYEAAQFVALIKNQIEKSGEQFSPEKFGEEMFGLRTSKKPLGKVVAERKSGCVVLYCENEEDFFEIYSRGRDKAEAEKSNEKNKATKIAELRKEAKEVGGTYCPDFLLGGENVRGVLINGKKTPEGEHRLIAHEIQHFINQDVFGMFEKIESAPQKNDLYRKLSVQRNFNKKVISSLGRVKDELLARLVEVGSSPKYCTEFVEHTLYENLTEDLTLEKPEVVLLMTEIKTKLMRAISRSQSKEQRLLFVASLLDVPLLDVPDAINDFVQYHRLLEAEQQPEEKLN